MSDDFTIRSAFKSLLYRYFGQTWAAAIANREFGVIADWFATYFCTIGLVALVMVACAAGCSGADGIGRETVLRETTPPHSERAELDYSLLSRTCQNVQAPGSLKHTIFVLGTPTPQCASVGLGLRIFALGLLLAGACTCIGWVFGLIFGVPRSGSTPDQNGANAGNTTALQINTNLMEISDWLTKTIVGVGLTQLMVLPKFLGDLAANINRFGFQWGDYGNLLALGEVLYFLPGGFWLGYVGTRTLLTGMFNAFALPTAKLETASSNDNVRLDGGNNIRPAKISVRPIDAVLLATPMRELQTEEQIVAWGAAQARAGNLAAARAAFEDALSSDPGNVDVETLLLKVYLATQAYDEAIVLAKKLPDSPAKMLALLYDDPPQGYAQALEIGKKLLSDPAQKDSASLHVWLACAYGQQYTYEKDATIRLTIQKNVDDEVTKAVQMDSSNATFLYSLWNPPTDSRENDLKDIPKNDPILLQLLKPPSVSSAQAAETGPVASPTPQQIDPDAAI